MTWNSRIRIQLSDVGKEMWRKHWHYPQLSTLPGTLAVSEDGFITVELWQAAHIFGTSLYNGVSDEHNPFANLLIEVVG